MLTYKILNHLPKLPEKFLQEAEALRSVDLDWRNGNTNVDPRMIVNEKIASYNGRKVKLNDKIIDSTYATRYRIDEFEQYVKEFITKDAITATLSFSAGSSYNGPHIDLTRDYALLYVVDPGGAEVYTAFYQEKGRPIVRPKDKPGSTVYGEYADDYANLIEVDRVILPSHTWAILNSNILHSVEGLTGPRITYQVGLNTNPFNNL
jgi:hypothetical protein